MWNSNDNNTASLIARSREIVQMLDAIGKTPEQTFANQSPRGSELPNLRTATAHQNSSSSSVLPPLYNQQFHANHSDNREENIEHNHSNNNFITNVSSSGASCENDDAFRKQVVIVYRESRSTQVEANDFTNQTHNQQVFKTSSMQTDSLNTRSKATETSDNDEEKKQSDKKNNNNQTAKKSLEIQTESPKMKNSATEMEDDKYTWKRIVHQIVMNQFCQTEENDSFQRGKVFSTSSTSTHDLELIATQQRNSEISASFQLLESEITSNLIPKFIERFSQKEERISSRLNQITHRITKASEKFNNKIRLEKNQLQLDMLLETQIREFQQNIIEREAENFLLIREAFLHSRNLISNVIETDRRNFDKERSLLKLEIAEMHASTSLSQQQQQQQQRQAESVSPPVTERSPFVSNTDESSKDSHNSRRSQSHSASAVLPPANENSFSLLFPPSSKVKLRPLPQMATTSSSNSQTAAAHRSSTSNPPAYWERKSVMTRNSQAGTIVSNENNLKKLSHSAVFNLMKECDSLLEL